MRDILHAARVSESSYHRAYKELVDAGILEVIVKGGGWANSRPEGRPNLYHIVPLRGGSQDDYYPPEGGSHVDYYPPAPLFRDTSSLKSSTATAENQSSETDRNNHSGMGRAPVGTGRKPPPPATVAPPTPLERSSYPPEFETAWSVYPNKASKKAAAAKWVATVRREGRAVVPQLVAAAQNYAAACRALKTEAQYTQHGATFYGPNEHWRDYVDAKAATPTQPRRTVPDTRGTFDDDDVWEQVIFQGGNR